MEAKSKQSSEAKDRQKGVPFYPPGYLHYPTDLLRNRFSRAECLAELEQELAAAWPQSFLQVCPVPYPAAVLRPACRRLLLIRSSHVINLLQITSP